VASDKLSQEFLDARLDWSNLSVICGTPNAKMKVGLHTILDLCQMNSGIRFSQMSQFIVGRITQINPSGAWAATVGREGSMSGQQAFAVQQTVAIDLLRAPSPSAPNVVLGKLIPVVRAFHCSTKNDPPQCNHTDENANTNEVSHHFTRHWLNYHPRTRR
jgi:hypothetical protein